MVRLDNGTELACNAAHAAHAALRRGARVVAGIRPERALVRPADAGLPLKIELIEELGVGRLVHGRLADNPMTLAIGPDEQLAATEMIGVSIPADAVHLFDAESGKRL
jgi:sn-glycerol 3-phosphate transport system ATP-binding protein